MDYNRTQLNSLIFHNQIVLPRTSSGFGEVSLAVAELQGGNYEKAAILAEIAVGKDPSLAAGWLAKMAADVYEATPDDLRKERAVFCLDRAFACAPSCRTDMVEFFLTHILAHYVQVLCAGAVEELGEWMQLEAQADHLDARAQSLHFRAAQTHGNASLLEAAGLVAGLMAVFSRRLGTQVFSGVASVAAFSEAALKQRDAALLDMQAQDLSAAASDLRLRGSEHRVASMLHLVPARDLIELGNRVAHAEGLSPQLLDPTLQGFVATFRQVGEGHLGWLRRQLLSPRVGCHRRPAFRAGENVCRRVRRTRAVCPAWFGPLQGQPQGTASPHQEHATLARTYGPRRDQARRVPVFGLPACRRCAVRACPGAGSRRTGSVRKYAAIYAAFLAIGCVVGIARRPVARDVRGWLGRDSAACWPSTALWSHGRVVKRERLRSLFLLRPQHRHLGCNALQSVPPLPGGPAAVSGLLPAAQASPKKRKGLLGCLGMVRVPGM